MQLIISNDIKIKEPSQEVIDYCQKELIIDNPEYVQAERLGRYLGNIEKKIKLYVKNGDELILPFGCLNDIWAISKSSPYILKFHPFLGLSMSGNIILYDYQEKALNWLLSGKNGILEAPCGSGKTQIGLQLIKSIGGRALWLTHTKKLLDQTKERCERYFTGDFGVITQGCVNIGKDITFATVQTMSKLDANVYRDAFDVVIVDECHHCVGSPTNVMQFYRILSNLNCRYKYGLSATLARSDNLIKTAFCILGKILYTIPKDAVGDKIIKAEHRRIDIDINYPLNEYLEVDGTINNINLLNMLALSKERNDIIISNVLKNVDEHFQLVLCHRVCHCKYLYDELSAKGIRCKLLIGRVKEKERELRDEQVIIATFSLAKEGLDIPMLDVLHLASPQKNESTTLQAVGRIERNVEGKQTPICFDYVDNNINYCVNSFIKRRRVLRRKS